MLGGDDVSGSPATKKKKPSNNEGDEKDNTVESNVRPSVPKGKTMFKLNSYSY